MIRLVACDKLLDLSVVTCFVEGALDVGPEAEVRAAGVDKGGARSVLPAAFCELTSRPETIAELDPFGSFDPAFSIGFETDTGVVLAEDADWTTASPPADCAEPVAGAATAEAEGFPGFDRAIEFDDSPFVEDVPAVALEVLAVFIRGRLSGLLSETFFWDAGALVSLGAGGSLGGKGRYIADHNSSVSRSQLVTFVLISSCEDFAFGSISMI